MIILHMEDESAEYSLTDIQGRTLANGKASLGDNNILNTLGKGGQLYILKVQTKNTIITFKINAL